MVYGAIAVLGVVPEIVGGLGLRPLQVAALLLIVLIALAHALVWNFMVESADPKAKVPVDD